MNDVGDSARLPLATHMLNRRTFFGHTASGLGSIALSMILSQERLLGENTRSVGGMQPIRPEIDPSQPFAPRPSHLQAAAKNVLVIFCSDACSYADTFDYKSELIKRHGQAMPGADKLVTFQGQQGNLTKSPWKFRPRGGMWQDDFRSCTTPW